MLNFYEVYFYKIIVLNQLQVYVLLQRIVRFVYDEFIFENFHVLILIKYFIYISFLLGGNLFYNHSNILKFCNIYINHNIYLFILCTYNLIIKFIYKILK